MCRTAGLDDCLVTPVALSQILPPPDQWLPIPLPAPVSVPISGTHPTGAPPGARAAGPLDRSVLAQISGGNAATERGILEDFRRVNGADVAVLVEAVARSDVSLVTRTTHRITGVSRMVGAFELAGMCERIERASRADDWATVAAGMSAFAEEWSRLNAYVDAY